MTHTDTNIAECKANLKKLMSELDTGRIIDQDFYENYEFEILQFSIEMSVRLQEQAYAKIKLIEEMSLRHERYKKDKEKNGEKYTFADGERATESNFMTKSTLQKENEALDDMNNRILNAYRRYGEVIKSRLISDMSDLKRLDTLQKSQNQ